MTKALGLQVLLGAVAGEDPGLARQVAAEVAGVGAGLTLLRYGREAEREADGYAVQEAYDAGIDPGGMATFFEKLLALHDEAPEEGGIARLFSTHPPTQERIEQVRADIAQLPPKKGLRKDSPRFQKAKAYLNEKYPMKKKAKK
jgi:predicted Zn-dependent protease